MQDKYEYPGGMWSAVKDSLFLLLIIAVILCMAWMLGQAQELPKSFTINDTTWKVQTAPEIAVVDPEHPNYVGYFAGWTCCPDDVSKECKGKPNTLQIVPSGNKCDESDTFIHELSHALVCGVDFEEQRMTGHYAIWKLAGPLSRTLGQNPQIQQYLNQATQGCK